MELEKSVFFTSREILGVRQGVAGAFTLLRRYGVEVVSRYRRFGMTYRFQLQVPSSKMRMLATGRYIIV
jgi:hypothetical protein